MIDAYEPVLKELLAKYPDLTVERALQEVQARGYRGGYTTVRERVRLLRPRPPAAPVQRFETGPAAQAQMDHAVYDLDFTREGRRRVYLFSYLLSYSRRQYLHFAESMDLHTTLCEHVQAFHHLGGVARVCLYDNFKAVVLRHDADGPLYNPKFLAFATHYGFKPRACQVRRPQTKGKVERKFFYVATSLLNGRTFDTLAHLNEVTAWWLANVADVRCLRDLGETPLQRHERERPELLPLPTADYDTALVVYRHVNAEGFITQRLNFYSVPWTYIGQVLPVRITENEVIIYSISLDEIARHALVPSTLTGMKQKNKSHHPAADPTQRALLLRQRFSELGPVAVQFLEGLLAKQIQGKLQAQQLLALVAHYRRDDVCAAFERAVRFGAFSLAAIRRILAAIAKPKPLLDELADLHREMLDPLLRDDVIGPRPTSDYQHLLLPEESADETLSEEKPQDEPDETDGGPQPA
jgi:transposase